MVIYFSMHVKMHVTEKTNLLKSHGSQIWPCLFMFRPNTLKQLNSVTGVDGRQVTLWTAVREVRVQIATLARIFVFVFFCFAVVAFIYFV